MSVLHGFVDGLIFLDKSGMHSYGDGCNTMYTCLVSDVVLMEY
jgi:hypothetical protein